MHLDTHDESCIQVGLQSLPMTLTVKSWELEGTMYGNTFNPFPTGGKETHLCRGVVLHTDHFPVSNVKSEVYGGPSLFKHVTCWICWGQIPCPGGGVGLNFFF